MLIIKKYLTTQGNNPVNLQYERFFYLCENFMCTLHEFTCTLLSVTVQDVEPTVQDIETIDNSVKLTALSYWRLVDRDINLK